MIAAGLKDDLLQEIRIVLYCIAPNQSFREQLRLAHNQIERLMKEYGWKKKKMKEIPFSACFTYQLPAVSIIKEKDNNSEFLEDFLSYYETHTARETCEHFGIEFTPKIQKLLHRCFHKHTGWGGNRRRLSCQS